MSNQVFQWTWLVLFYGWTASEIGIGIVTRTRGSKGNVRDRGSLPLLWIVIFSTITYGMSYRLGPNLPGPGIFYRWASLLILAAGLVFRWTAILTLGKSFSSNVAIRSTQTVLKTGLYRWMRHPSYSGLLLCIFAAALHTHNCISLLVIMLPSTAALLYRIHVEEIALRDHFGPEYVDYSRQTKRLVPGLY